MNRKSFSPIVGCLIGLFVVPGIWGAALYGADRPPNILVIVADDLGYGEIGCQGSDISTPNIDSLAATGVRLTNGYVSCPVCAPTRAGLLTGRYQQRFGFELNPGPESQADARFGLPLEEVTLAERLKSLGYVTGAVGKWHLGYRPEVQPMAHGFDEFFGFLGGGNSYFPNPTRTPILRNREPVEEKEYLTDAFGGEAVAFIDRHHAKPFFLYLCFNAVHTPLHATEDRLQEFVSIADTTRRTFAAMLWAMDENIGRVLEALRKHGLEEETLIFFISDNGGPTRVTTSSNGPLRGFKGQVLEGGIRVPFIIRWKDHLPAGMVYDQPVICLDIYPTALAAAGATIDPSWRLDGVNLLPYLKGERKDPPHQRLFWRFNQQYAIREGQWKLVRLANDPTVYLYNLAEDIGETTNLAESEPARVKALQEAWDRWNSELMPPLWRAQRQRTAGQQPAVNAATVVEQFKTLDRNGDGKLSRDELPRPRLFQRLDQNGDGAVTLEEAQTGAGIRRDN